MLTPKTRRSTSLRTSYGVPKEARWSFLQANAKRPEIGKLIDEAMDAIEKAPSNEGLKGVLPKNYARPALNKTMLGELIDLFSNMDMHDSTDRARDLLGRVYEYFLSGGLPAPKASSIPFRARRPPLRSGRSTHSEQC
jgi:type I restriction-modification system DNA methylase subunit